MDLEEIRKLFISIVWTDLTREEHPSKDLIGYNTEHKRIEYYIHSQDQWYYMWADEIGGIPVPPPVLFSDDFETGWVISSIYLQVFNDNFEIGWLVPGPYTNLFNDNFETGWTIINPYTTIFSELFNESDWFEFNPYGNIYTEDFEDGSWN